MILGSESSFINAFFSILLTISSISSLFGENVISPSSEKDTSILKIADKSEEIIESAFLKDS